MRVEVVRPRELSEEQVRRWNWLQETNPALVSPYFCYEFTRAVGDVRDDAFVGVIEDDGEVIGFFPFQRRALGVGKPIGGPLSDYQGVIAGPAFDWDGAALVRGCGLSVYDFDHMLASQRTFAPYHREETYSPIMDLSQGFEAYVEARRRAKSRIVKSNRRKVRKLEREVGPLRFEVHEDTPAVFAALKCWKREQYHRTGAYDVFRHDWTLRLLQNLCRTQSDSFAGIFSCLYANERLMAVHFGMRSRTVWHQWFPAYDRAFFSYSPGIMLVLKMAEHAPSLGISTIDMGWGDVEDKQRFGDGKVPIAVGRVENASAVAKIRRVGRATDGAFQSLPLGPISMVPRKAYDRIERRLNFT